jgi:four helix bundle protein
MVKNSKIDTFEDILVWQKARILVNSLYKSFSNCKDWSFVDQIRRAGVSTMNNIAEGFERKGNKEFSNFLFIAKGSVGEVRSMLHLAKDLTYIKENEYCILSGQTIIIAKMLSAFISSLKT